MATTKAAMILRGLDSAGHAQGHRAAFNFEIQGTKLGDKPVRFHFPFGMIADRIAWNGMLSLIRRMSEFRAPVQVLCADIET
jgi:hypothetical protein